MDAIGSGSFDEFRRHVAADVSLRIEGAEHLPWVHAASGAANFWRVTMTNFTSVIDLTSQIYRVHAEGDLVTLGAHERGRLAASGNVRAQHVEQRWTFRDGLLARWHGVGTELPEHHPALAA